MTVKRRQRLLLAGLLAATLLVFSGQPALCNHCLPTFCGNSAECPQGCFCAIPMGEATGACFGTR